MADELLFTVAGSSAKRATPISLAEAGLRERQDLQEWVLKHPEILGPGVMVVTFEFDRWWSSSGNQPVDRLDVLGLDGSGTLVVTELKRDRAPDTVEMQAIKYAAMASRFTLESLASQHARFRAARGRPCTDEEAMASLTAHAEEVTAESLRRPRIVLLASDYPPVVTATVVWLTEMSLDVTLMKFRAYRTQSETLLSVSQVYPVPDVEEFAVSSRQAEVRAAVESPRHSPISHGSCAAGAATFIPPLSRSDGRHCPPHRAVGGVWQVRRISTWGVLRSEVANSDRSFQHRRVS